mgnify:CR=1 FL=1
MPRYTNQEIIEGLQRHQGMVYLAAEAMHCSPHTILARLKNSPEVKAIYVALRGHRVDVAELKLYDQTLAGEPWAVQFTLKTIGKDRGYSERQEVTGEGGGPQVIKVVYDNPDKA